MSTADWIKVIFYMIASVGLLLTGFEMLSSNLTKLCHTGLKKLFNKTSKSNLIGVGIGAAATAIMQSSAVTTVMVVGFVNTGVMSLAQATAIIMGANIGTTITAQLASLSSFDFGAYVIVFAGIGVFISMLSKKEKTKTLGLAFAGFGLLFLGLECMSAAMKNDAVKQAISNVLSNVNGPLAPLYLFLIGIVLTALVQSSSLITTIVISLSAVGIYIGSNTGALSNNVLFLILGTNIGTCVTAIISSIGTNINAKRASCIHLLFNTFGALIFIIILLIFPRFMEVVFGNVFNSPATQIAMFHTFFNVICTIIFLPFINLFVKLSMVIVRDRNTKEEEPAVCYIDDRMILSPSIAIHQVRKELGLMYKKAIDALNAAIDGFYENDVEKKAIVDKLNDQLEQTNRLVIDYMVKLSSEQIVYEDECTISSFHRVLNDILRIGEIGDNICKYTRHMVRDELKFSDEVMVQLSFMRKALNDQYSKTEVMFITKDLSKLKDIDDSEEEIDVMRKALIDDHFDRLNKGQCSPSNSGVFVNLVNNLERAADHMCYIAHSVQEASDQAHSNLK